MSKHPTGVTELLDRAPEYATKFGAAYLGDSRNLLLDLPTGSIDLVVTSPPFDLAVQKEYGSEWKEDYISWFTEFADEIRRVLAPHGSFVVELGGAFKQGQPERSTYQFELLSRLTAEHDYKLAQDFYWHNPAKLPSPAEWVTRRRIRVSDAVTHVWWLAPEITADSATDPDESPIPEADNRRVLTDYTDSHRKLLETGQYNAGERPSGHNISESGFSVDQGGAIPDNLISASNTDSRDHYLQMCRHYDLEPHPARFPDEIPEFFINFLTPDPPYDDWERGYLDRPIILDIFGGSNVTGKVAEDNERYWISFEKDAEYIEKSEIRFLSKGEVSRKYDDAQRGLESYIE